MKAYHYILIIAALILGWYCYKKGKAACACQCPKPKKEDKPDAPASDTDTSKNADVATLTCDEALAIAKQDPADLSLANDSGDAPEYQYTLSWTDEDGNWHNEIISEKTYETLVAKGIEPDIN